jgi:hypothetical protein
MIRLTLAAASFLLLSACASLSPVQQKQLLETTSVSSEYQFDELPSGMQSDPELKSGVIELPAGKTFYKGYQLKAGHAAMALQLRTFIQGSQQGDGFFYPVIELYDFNMRSMDVIRPQLRFTQLSAQGRYAVVPITVTREVGYFVIRTEPKLYGQEASYTTKHQGASWSYSVTPFTKRKPASYLPLGELELLTPDEGFSRPYEKMSGFYWQFSMNKGSEDLASGEDYLPDLTLGAGPEFTLGYSFSVPGRPLSSIRTGLGASFLTVNESGTSHSQKFLSADVLWVESNQVSSVGFGVTSRFAHEYRTSGVTTEFDPVFGPKLLIEIRGSMGVTLGAHMSWLDYKTESGETMSGDYMGLYLAKFY